MFKRRSSLLTSVIGITLLSLSLLSNEAAAQETSANIRGSVVDAKGAVIPDAKITVINDSQGLQRETTTNKEGYYIIPFLPAGTYTLTAEMPGFATVRVPGIVLQVSINTTVPITLEPKGVEAAVSVETNSNKIDATDATIKYSITNEQVRGLPVLTTTTGRNVLSILPFLVAGASPTTDFASIGSNNNARENRGASISINGSRTISISYNFEGGDNNDGEFNTASSPLPNPDALQEFTVVTNNYQADLGRSAGGVINAVAKSGTNNFHGNARYFRIHESLNARRFFDRTKPLNRLNTLGGQIGGPVILPWVFNGRNLTHFFFDYEGTRTRSDFDSAISVLTPQERKGDFSNLPLAQWPRDPLTGQPFPGGIIPASRINSISQTYLDRFIPVPNEGASNFRQLVRTVRSNDQVTTRIDQKISQADNLSITYFYTRSDSVFGSENLPVASKDDSLEVNHNLVLRETRIFSPRTVNQFTGTFTRFVDDFRGIAGSADGIHPRDIGITGVHPQTDQLLSAPFIRIDGVGLAVGSNGTASLRAKTTWQVKDDLSYTRGKFSWKFGAEIRSFVLRNVLGHDNGNFTFSSSNSFATRNSIADFLLGIPSSYSQGTGNIIYPQQRSYNAYAMADVRPRSNITINLGLRYELAIPMKDKLDELSVFRPGQKSQRFPNAPTGVLFVGDPDPVLGRVPRAGYPTDKNNFAPRVSIAFSPSPKHGWLRTLLGDGKTAIRAGGGVFYDQTYGFSFSQFLSIQPFSVRQSLSSTQINSAGGTFANPFGSLPNPWPLDLSSRVFTGTPGIQPFDPTFRSAYTYQYNLSIQRELPGSLVMELSYVGSNTFKANLERELNVATVGPGATTGNLQSRRLYPQLGSIPNQESTGRGRFNSFQARLTKRFRGGLAFDGSYVFGKSFDNGSSPLGQGTSTAVGAAASQGYPLIWARSAFDRRHNFVVSYTYDLPTVKQVNMLGRLLNGWQLGGITQFRSGAPLDITQLVDTTLSGRFARGNPDFVGPYVKLDPRQRQTIVVNGVPRTGNFFFDPNAFRVVTVADFTQARPGTLGRNVFDGPGINDWAVAIIKQTSLFEAHKIEIRADVRNLFNHANFGNLSLSANNSDFGQVRLSSPGRTIQLSAKYIF